MINLQIEQPILLSEVSNRLPKRHGKKVHYSTVYRWVLKGVRGRVLESIQIGGVRYTSLEALNRFLESGCPSPAKHTDLNAINEALDEAGL